MNFLVQQMYESLLFKPVYGLDLLVFLILKKKKNLPANLFRITHKMRYSQLAAVKVRGCHVSPRIIFVEIEGGIRIHVWSRHKDYSLP